MTHLAIRRREIHNQTSFKPGSQTSLHARELGERHTGAEDHLAARLDQIVEENEQLILSTVLVGDEVHVVKEKRSRRTISGPPGTHRISIDGFNQVAGKLMGAETRDGAFAPGSQCV